MTLYAQCSIMINDNMIQKWLSKYIMFYLRLMLYL